MNKTLKELLLEKGSATVETSVTNYTQNELLYIGSVQLKDELKGTYIGHVVDKDNEIIIFISTEKVFICDADLAGKYLRINKI